MYLSDQTASIDCDYLRQPSYPLPLTPELAGKMRLSFILSAISLLTLTVISPIVIASSRRKPVSKFSIVDATHNINNSTANWQHRVGSAVNYKVQSDWDRLLEVSDELIKTTKLNTQTVVEGTKDVGLDVTYDEATEVGTLREKHSKMLQATLEKLVGLNFPICDPVLNRPAYEYLNNIVGKLEQQKTADGKFSTLITGLVPKSFQDNYYRRHEFTQDAWSKAIRNTSYQAQSKRGKYFCQRGLSNKI
jgi:hypothetical protein